MSLRIASSVAATVVAVDMFRAVIPSSELRFKDHSPLSLNTSMNNPFPSTRTHATYLYPYPSILSQYPWLISSPPNPSRQTPTYCEAHPLSWFRTIRAGSMVDHWSRVSNSPRNRDLHRNDENRAIAGEPLTHCQDPLISESHGLRIRNGQAASPWISVSRLPFCRYGTEPA